MHLNKATWLFRICLLLCPKQLITFQGVRQLHYLPATDRAAPRKEADRGAPKSELPPSFPPSLSISPLRPPTTHLPSIISQGRSEKTFDWSRIWFSFSRSSLRFWEELVVLENGEEEESGQPQCFAEEASLLQSLDWRFRAAAGESLNLLIFTFLLPFSLFCLLVLLLLIICLVQLGLDINCLFVCLFI